MISDQLEEAGNEWNKDRSNGINFKYFTPDFVSFLLLFFQIKLIAILDKYNPNEYKMLFK